MVNNVLCALSYTGLPQRLSSKESSCNAGDAGLIPGSRISPGEGNGNLLQYSCLEHSMDRGAWWAAVHGVAKNQTYLSDCAFTYCTDVHSDYWTNVT